METKHSPGPWYIDALEGDEQRAIVDDNGDLVADLFPSTWDNEAGGVPEDYRVNAPVIAAAPLLLRDLKRLLASPDLNLDTLELETQLAIREAQTTVRQAEGQS